MREKRTPIIIRIEPQLHEGLKSMVARCGESAGVIVRGLLREELIKRGITETDIRRKEDSFGIGGRPASQPVRPLARADK